MSPMNVFILFHCPVCRGLRIASLPWTWVASYLAICLAVYAAAVRSLGRRALSKLYRSILTRFDCSDLFWLLLGCLVAVMQQRCGDADDKFPLVVDAMITQICTRL